MSTVETNGVEMYYERRGDGPTVVFVHGAGLDHRMWTPQMETLEDEFEVVAYDYRGHGQTGPTDREAYSIEMFADDLRGLIEELNIQNPILCGHSYGGLIVGEYATQHPEETAGVIFADGRIDFGETRFEQVFIRLWPALQRVVETVGQKRFMQGLSRLTQYFIDAETGPDEEIDGLGMTRSEYQWDVREYTNIAESSKLYSAGDRYDGVTLDRVDCSVLVAYGDGTASVLKTEAGRLAGRVDDVRVEVVEGAGHDFTLVKAGEFNDLLHDWLPTTTVVGE
jgi:pimeloyl-ACP methyl ester carboxylesterase